MAHRAGQPCCQDRRVGDEGAHGRLRHPRVCQRPLEDRQDLRAEGKETDPLGQLAALLSASMSRIHGKTSTDKFPYISA